LRAVPQTFEIFIQLRRAPPRQRVDDPILLPIGDDHASLAQVGEVFGNLYLRFIEDVLEMADAERRLRKQVKDTKSCSIAETLINSYQIHSVLRIYL